jgi:hypothetical protein
VSTPRRPHVLLLLAGVGALLLGGALALAPARTVRDVGAVPVTPARPVPATPSTPPAGPPPLPPVRLELAGSATARVVPVGVNGQAGLSVPDDPRMVGWWSGGAAPGAVAGSVVLAGHVDTAAAGLGALSALAGLEPGALVRLDTKDRRYAYRVAARRTYAKAALPLDVFDQAVGARLVLITCTGSFHNGHYDDNLVVYAQPIPNP